jgi:hypothetical protein
MKTSTAAPFSLVVTDAGLTMRERLHRRTCTIAAQTGRNPCVISQADYEQAKRDVTGESDLDLQNAMLDSPLTSNSSQDRLQSAL